MSEEFGGLRPSIVIDELQRLPVGFMEQIIEYRRYAEAKAANDADPDPVRRQSTPMRMLANEIEFDLAEEEITTRA